MLPSSYVADSLSKGIIEFLKTHYFSEGVAQFCQQSNITSITSGLKVFPNPVKDYLTIQSIQNLNTIELFNSLGHCIYRDNLLSPIERIDLSFLEDGIYILKIRMGKHLIAQQKLIKQ